MLFLFVKVSKIELWDEMLVLLFRGRVHCGCLGNVEGGVKPAALPERWLTLTF